VIAIYVPRVLDEVLKKLEKLKVPGYILKNQYI